MEHQTPVLPPTRRDHRATPLTRVLHSPSVSHYSGISSPDYRGAQKLVGNNEGVALGWYVAPWG